MIYLHTVSDSNININVRMYYNPEDKKFYYEHNLVLHVYDDSVWWLGDIKSVLEYRLEEQILKRLLTKTIEKL